MPPKIAGKAERKTKKSATVVSPKQLRKLTKDGLISLLTKSKLSTTGTRPQLLQRLTKRPKDRQNDYKRPPNKHACKQGAAHLGAILPPKLILHTGVRNTHPQVQETQDRNSAIQTCSLNQLLDPDPTRVSHPAVTTTTYPAVGITHTGVSRPAVSILVLHTYPAVGITQTGVSRPAVSILVLHTYPAVDITHAGVSLPAVSTLIRYTGSAGHIDPVGVTQTLESDTDTREVQHPAGGVRVGSLPKHRYHF